MKILDKKNRNKLIIEFKEGGEEVSMTEGPEFYFAEYYLQYYLDYCGCKPKADITIKGSFSNMRYFLATAIQAYVEDQIERDYLDSQD